MITDFTNQAMFTVATDFGDIGFGGSDLTNSFDEAVDRFNEHMEQGNDSRVIRIDLSDGKSSDITADAIDRIIRHLNSARIEYPEWLVDFEVAA